MRRPYPTPIFRLFHLDGLETVIARGAIHAPNFLPADGRPYRAIHRADVQVARRDRKVPCGPGGTVGDYVSFYLGPRSVMLYQLHTGSVPGYSEGQEPLIVAVCSVSEIVAEKQSFVFTDRHSLASYAKWSAREEDLNDLDWATIYAQDWKNTEDDPDRQSRKQAEFLVHRIVPWSLVRSIAVVSKQTEKRVNAILDRVAPQRTLTVRIRPNWYY